MRPKFLWNIVDPRGTKESGEIFISLLLVHRKHKIVLDGNLEEWEGLPIALANRKVQVVVGSENWRGEEDCSRRLRAGWGSKNLYPAIEVEDDKFVPPPQPTWRMDSVELFFDTDLYGDWGTASTNTDDFKITVEAQTESSPHFSGPQSVTGASSVAGKVRRLEVAIPLKELNLEPSVGTPLGFDIAVDDADQQGKRRKL